MAIFIGGPGARRAADARRRTRQRGQAEVAEAAAARAASRARLEKKRREVWEVEREARLAKQQAALLAAEEAGLAVTLRPVPLEPPEDWRPLPPKDVDPVWVDPEAVRAFAAGGRNAYNADVAFPVDVQEFWKKHGELPGFAAGT